MEARELVCQYLHALCERGVSRLPVDDEARSILRDWMLAARRGTPLPRRSQIPAPEPVLSPSAPSAPVPAPPALSSSVSAAPPALPPGGLLAELEAEDAAARARAALDADADEENPLPFFRPAGSSPQQMWASFAELLSRWKPLRELGTLREKAVPGQGSRTASVMFVGDAPGVQDERSGLPFQGEAGAKLDGMLRAMGLTRDEVYITHLVKFRPAMPRQTLNNRPPTAREIALSVPILTCEVQLIRPRVIVALGVIAARGLLNCGDLPLAACQGLEGSFCGIPVMVTHHPSYLLRTNDLCERRRLWEEMLRVMEMAGLPISAKQRGYFLKANA